MEGNGFFFQAAVYLLAAVLSVPLAKRMGLGSVLGYLMAGVVIGPFVLGLVGEEQGDVMHFAEFGVVMMLFLIGLELRPSRLWRMRGPLLGLGGLQVALTSVALAVGAFALGLNLSMSVATGLILALSSTAIVLQTLTEKGLLKRDAGQNTFSVLLFQDIAVIPILALLPLLGAGASEGMAHAAEGTHAVQAASPAGWQQALMVVAVVAVIILSGRFLMRHIFRFIAETRLREIFTAAALLLVIAIALAMQRVGLSPALGTFLAGVVLADSEYRHELESDIEPFKGLLLGLFFISVGASIDFGLLFRQPLLVAGLVLGLVVVKGLVLLVLGKIFRMPLSENFLFSFSLAQGGEFAFVLFSFATQNRVLPPEVTNPLVVVVALSMLITPLLMIFNDKLVQPRFRQSREERKADEIDERDNPVIIAGFGRFGQIVGRLLGAHGIRSTVLELDPGQIETLRRFGEKVFYGNASRMDLLEAAGAGEARLFVLAIDDREKGLGTVDTVKKQFPHLKILARAQDRVHAYELMKRGVDFIARETFDSALATGVEALRMMGFRAYQAHRAAQIFKAHDLAAMQQTFTLWGDMKAYVFEAKKQLAELERVLQADHHEGEPESDRAWDIAKLRQDVIEDQPLVDETVPPNSPGTS